MLRRSQSSVLGGTGRVKLSLASSRQRFALSDSISASWPVTPTDNLAMKAIELIGDIDEQHRLHARVPSELAAGQVRLIVLLPTEDEAGDAWAHGTARKWSAELRDPRQDIYTLDDGQPMNAPR